jgi:hypothetical protein
MPKRTGKYAKMLPELMTKGVALVNATCCLSMEEEDKGYINMVKCDGVDDSSGG